MRNSRESSLKKESVMEINDVIFSLFSILSISLKLSLFKLNSLLFLIIYPYKFLGLTIYIYYLFYICESAYDNGVKLVTFYPIIKSRITYLKYMNEVKGQSR